MSSGPSVGGNLSSPQWNGNRDTLLTILLFSCFGIIRDVKAATMTLDAYVLLLFGWRSFPVSCCLMLFPFRKINPWLFDLDKQESCRIAIADTWLSHPEVIKVQMSAALSVLCKSWVNPFLARVLNLQNLSGRDNRWVRMAGEGIERFQDGRKTRS